MKLFCFFIWWILWIDAWNRSRFTDSPAWKFLTKMFVRKFADGQWRKGIGTWRHYRSRFEFYASRWLVDCKYEICMIYGQWLCVRDQIQHFSVTKSFLSNHTTRSQVIPTVSPGKRRNRKEWRYGCCQIGSNQSALVYHSSFLAYGWELNQSFKSAHRIAIVAPIHCVGFCSLFELLEQFSKYSSPPLPRGYQLMEWINDLIVVETKVWCKAYRWLVRTVIVFANHRR